MKRIMFVLLLLVVSMSSGFAEEVSLENQALFDKAEEEFRVASEAGDNNPEVADAAYLRAAELFTQVIRNGTKNSEIYYNLGNCYYQAKDFPMAILQYRRAMVYAPDDEKIQSNLASAQRMIGKSEPVQNDLTLMERVVAFNARIPLFVKQYFNMFSYGLFWSGVIMYFFLRKRLKKKIFVGIMLVWFISLVSIALISYCASTNADGVILSEETVARKGDGENYAEVFKKPLSAGTEFKLIEKRGDWLKIELTTGNKCWIKADNAGLVKNEP